MKRKWAVVVILMLIAAVYPSFGQNTPVYESELVVLSPKVTALGGRHTALASGFSTLFTNPAGLYSVPPELSISELTFGLTGPVFTIGSMIIEGLTTGDISGLLADPSVQALLTNIYSALNITGPIYFGYLGNGLGFGIFNSTDLTFYNPRPLALAVKMEESLILCGGYSFRIPLAENHNLDLGILLKGMIRGELTVEKALLELMDFGSIGLDTLMTSPFSFISAIGVDAGIRYSYREIFVFGLSGRDLYTPTLRNKYASLQDFLDSGTPQKVSGLVPLTLNAGLMIRPPLGTVSRYISDFKILLDYEDILDFVMYPAVSTHPILHIGLGTELVLLDILSLRGGFYQGLFAAGMGLDLTLFRLNVSMFGQERSTEIGQNSVYNLQIGFEFRL